MQELRRLAGSAAGQNLREKEHSVSIRCHSSITKHIHNRQQRGLQIAHLQMAGSAAQTRRTPY